MSDSNSIESISTFKDRVLKWIDRMETSAKVIGSAIAIIAFLSLLFPVVDKAVASFIAWRFGATGYVYYEINDDNGITGDGQLRLLKSGAADYGNIHWGDKLQSATAVHFRDEADKSARVMFVLKEPNCLIVLSPVREVDVTKAKSGGWFYVGTTSCGLFN